MDKRPNSTVIRNVVLIVVVVVALLLAVGLSFGQKRAATTNPLTINSVPTTVSSQKEGTSTTIKLQGQSAPSTSTVATTTSTTTSPLAQATPGESTVINFAVNYNTYNHLVPFVDSSVSQYVDPSVASSMLSQLHSLQANWHYNRETRVVDMSSVGATLEPGSQNVYYVALIVEVTSPFDLNQYGQILTKPEPHSYKLTLGPNGLIDAMTVIS